MKHLYLLALLLPILHSCSPLKSSAKDGKHQIELTLHEVQTSLDDLRHDVHCFQTELQILDGKIKHHESALSGLKQGYLEKQEEKLEEFEKLLVEFQKKLTLLESLHMAESKDIKQLSLHANDTSSALAQYKERINDLERQFFIQSKKFEEIAKLKSTLENLSYVIQKENADPMQLKIYKVKAGDSLDKIAKAYQINVEYLKKINNMQHDLIKPGQELKVP